MNLKLNCAVIVTLFILISSNCAQEIDDDIKDFDFGNENLNHSEEDLETSEEEFENDVDYEEAEEEEVKPPDFAKAAVVRQVMLNSMKSQEMKDKMARVLPILRVMTPEQKLALASLVTAQVLTPPNHPGLSLDQVTAMFGNNTNTTAELMLPISLDVANMFRNARNEKGPVAEELRMPYKRPPGLYRRNIIDRKPSRIRKPIKAINNSKEQPNCELFTSGVCLKSHDYPIEAIMASIRRNKHAMSALLTDVKSMSTDGSTDGVSPEQETKQSSNDDESNEIRRTGGESGFMCPSIVRYARPQKARATNGEWKYIVNTPDHTQTLRLERCVKAGDTCTYLTDNFKSRCVQVFNYHRLLTWDKTNGLHMDIFKVPTCCSCHIDSYKVPFPPHHPNHATTVEDFPGEDIDTHHSTVATDSDYYSNSIPGSNQFRKELPNLSHQFDFSDSNYQPESTKIKPLVERPSLSKYLEAPKVQAPISKPEYNNNFKRPNTPKPFSHSNKRPVRPVRRRQPSKPVRDLTQSETNFGSHTTNVPLSTTGQTKEFTKKINYNYHPIIDFFKPDLIESRMDVDFTDSEWKPVTSMIFVTEKSKLR